MTGMTYSAAHYEQYEKTKNKNIFEEVIDKVMLDGLDPVLQEKIKDLPLKDKRMNILAFLDKDRNLFMKIKSFIQKEKLSKMDHLKEVITMLREYVKVGEVEKKKFGEVMTDMNLVKHILSRIPKESFCDPTTTFVDFANGTGVFPLIIIYRLMLGLVDIFPDPDERYRHIVENQIYVSEIQPKNMFLYMCLVDPYDEYTLNIYTGSSLEVGFREHMKSVWKIESFDYGVGNPPFNQMIDMKFVRLSYELCIVTCIVHPSTWLLDEKNRQSRFVQTKSLVSKHLDNIELFNGNKIFGIQLFVPCVITYIDRNKTDENIKCIDKIQDVEVIYNNINDINKYSNNDLYFELKNKIKKHSNIDNLYRRLLNDTGNNYYVNLSQIRGHVDLMSDSVMVKPDFYTMVTKDLTPSKYPRKQREKTQASFETLEECNNLISYVKTNFARFCLSLNKNNQNLYCGEMEDIPWMDFKRSWSDISLYDFFNLTLEEIDFINKNIPKYYE